MSDGPSWERTAERGSIAAMRAMAFLYRVLGRSTSQLLLYPIVAYFFVRGSAGRRASRRFLERVWATPEGRVRLGRRKPGFTAPFWHFHEFAVQLLDRFVLWGGGIDAFTVDYRGAEHLEQLARERRGALFLGAHLGSFDIAREFAKRNRVRLNVVMFTAHAERINRFFEEHNPESSLRVLRLDPGSVRTAFEIRSCIDRGEIVAMLADRLPAGGRERPIPIEFLGARIPFPRSPFLLACLLGCPVFLSLCVRTGAGRYETFVEPIGDPVRVPRQQRDKCAEELAGAWARRLETSCQRFPYQWFNFYDPSARGGDA